LEPGLIQHTWVSRSTQGVESLVTIQIDPEGDQSRVRIVHSNLPDDDEGRGHSNAWGYVLGCMLSRFKQN